MKFGNRVVCFAFSAAVAGAVYTQIPVGSGLAAAYGGGGGGKTVVAAAAAGGVIDIVATSITTAGGAGAGIAPTVSKAISSPPDGTTVPDASPAASPSEGADGASLIDMASATVNPDLSIYNTVSDLPDVKEALKTGGPYTIFAPTNTVFDDFGKNSPKPFDVASEYKKPENLSLLKAFLFSHVVKGKYTIVDLKDMEGRKLTTLRGDLLTVSTLDTLKVNGRPVQETDIPADSASVIHPIGRSVPSPVVVAAAE